jgi:hypothetical protein
MSIKPGDLAYIIKSKSPENLGKIVSVGQPVIPGVRYTINGKKFYTCYPGRYLCYTQGSLLLANMNSGKLHPVPTLLKKLSSLRKIGFPEGQDETLTWAEKPKNLATKEETCNL